MSNVNFYFQFPMGGPDGMGPMGPDMPPVMNGMCHPPQGHPSKSIACDLLLVNVQTNNYSNHKSGVGILYVFFSDFCRKIHPLIVLISVIRPTCIINQYSDVYIIIHFLIYCNKSNKYRFDTSLKKRNLLTSNVDCAEAIRSQFHHLCS